MATQKARKINHRQVDYWASSQESTNPSSNVERVEDSGSNRSNVIAFKRSHTDTDIAFESKNPHLVSTEKYSEDPPLHPQSLNAGDTAESLESRLSENARLRQRHRNNPSITWMCFILGSVVIHLLGFWVFNRLMARPLVADINTELIPVEIIENVPEDTLGKSQPRNPKKLQGDRNSVSKKATPPPKEAPNNLADRQTANRREPNLVERGGLPTNSVSNQSRSTTADRRIARSTAETPSQSAASQTALRRERNLVPRGDLPAAPVSRRSRSATPTKPSLWDRYDRFPPKQRIGSKPQIPSIPTDSGAKSPKTPLAVRPVSPQIANNFPVDGSRLPKPPLVPHKTAKDSPQINVGSPPDAFPPESPTKSDSALADPSSEPNNFGFNNPQDSKASETDVARGSQTNTEPPKTTPSRADTDSTSQSSDPPQQPASPPVTSGTSDNEEVGGFVATLSPDDIRPANGGRDNPDRLPTLQENSKEITDFVFVSNIKSNRKRTLVLETVIDENGKAELGSIKILRGSSELAEDLLKDWQFNPAQTKEQSVPMRVELSFKLKPLKVK